MIPMIQKPEAALLSEDDDIRVVDIQEWSFDSILSKNLKNLKKHGLGHLADGSKGSPDRSADFREQGVRGRDRIADFCKDSSSICDVCSPESKINKACN